MSVTFSGARIEMREWGGEQVEACVPVPELGELGFNLSNLNAMELLRFIGIEADPVGTRAAAEIEGACLIALGLREPSEDRARPLRESRGDGGALMIECPRAEGYLAERTRWLAELARAAGAGGHLVSWG